MTASAKRRPPAGGGVVGAASVTPPSVPLDACDCPEDFDFVFAPAACLAAARAAGSPGLPAVSRYYDPSGGFCWAPCLVTGFDE